MTAPRVHTIVLNYNGKHLLRPCLDSLLAQDLPEARVLLVDNGSSDGSLEFARGNYPAVDILDNKANLYFAAGNNRGIEQALNQGAAYVFLLNNDTVCQSGCLARLVEYMEGNPKAGACQPLLTVMDRPGMVASAGCRLSLTGRGWDHRCGEPTASCGTDPFPVLGVTGGAMFLRSEALRRVGLFDPDFQMYLEDVDLSLRLRQAGWELACVPEARVAHMISATTDSVLGLPSRVFYCERNSYAVILKNFPPLRAAVGVLMSVGVALIACASNLLRGNLAHCKALLTGTLAGLASIPRCLDKRRSIARPDGYNYWPLMDAGAVVPPDCGKRMKQSAGEGTG